MQLSLDYLIGKSKVLHQYHVPIADDETKTLGLLPSGRALRTSCGAVPRVYVVEGFMNSEGAHLWPTSRLFIKTPYALTRIFE
jgi:hypothetical protein